MIRRYIFFLLLFTPVSIKADVHIDRVNIFLNESIQGVEQWVYLFGIHGNDYILTDSCFIPATAQSCSIQVRLPGDEFSMYWLTFSVKGPNQLYLFLDPGEDIDIFIGDTSWGSLPKGSKRTEEIYNYMKGKFTLNRRISQLKDSLLILMDDPVSANLKDTLDYYITYEKTGYKLDYLKDARTPGGYFWGLMTVEDDIPGDMRDSLIYVMKDRFRDSPTTQNYYNPDFNYPPESEQSRIVRNKFRSLKSAKVVGKDGEEEREVEINSEELALFLSTITPYELEDKIDSLFMPGLDGTVISLDELNTEYILIDFWAAWCGPCRREIPYIKEVVEKYPSYFSVYAISLDNREKDWKDAIESDQSESFTHVYGGNLKMKEGIEICARFGVKGIPANFLLDKERRIIATDLRGERLMSVMDKLINPDI